MFLLINNLFCVKNSSLLHFIEMTVCTQKKGICTNSSYIFDFLHIDFSDAFIVPTKFLSDSKICVLEERTVDTNLKVACY